ncbi:Outer membrane protein [Borrelia nietonii YOR]|uniref:Outer membrane protein n=1 Tax=Borrelia nietonii YOR TaxID=1293576 RepID=A0ABM5PI92_9SPIR|nr:OmpH family outer membrane protein [Borrelia nietonii]AHH03808.1 Outer membrane protein [Borrelia nietonii YOR]UPA09475.1 OmpH family outer membrane protein [Borrelia nietonii YOR]
MVYMMLLFACFFPLNLFSVNVTKVGIVDFEKVVIGFLSPQLKSNLEQLKNHYQDKIDTLNSEIKDLRKMYDESVSTHDLENAKSYGNQYNLKIDELKRLKNLAKSNLEQQKQISINSLNSDGLLWGKILNGIQYVAETNGISLVMKKDNPYILYYNSTVDVTDDVIKYLNAQ